MAVPGPRVDKKRKRTDIVDQNAPPLTKASAFFSLIATGLTGTPFNFNGESLLHIAVQTQTKNELKHILEAIHPLDNARAWWNGTTPEAEQKIRIDSFINIKDKNGNTALHVAAMENLSEMAELLIAKGASLTIINNDRQTPAQLALLKGDVELAGFLGLKLAAEVGSSAVSAISNVASGISRFFGLSSSASASASSSAVYCGSASSSSSASSESSFSFDSDSQEEGKESAAKKQKVQ